MKLKSLLLGSAAVFVAVSGARAADAIIVEPEPVEYVRVCDAYGAGWWYIPGTETCIKFSGDVRIQYGATHYHDGKGAYNARSFDANGFLTKAESLLALGFRDGANLPTLGDIEALYNEYLSPAYYDSLSSHEFNYRARLNVYANNETEYGTLASRIRFVAASDEGDHGDAISLSEGPSSANAVVDWAVISLAGFRVGFADDYWTTAGSYGYYNARFDGPYNFRNGLFFDYTYAANGWTATVGIEDGGVSGEAGQPDVYAGLTYSGSGWYLAGIYYYDSSESAGAYKLRADYDFGTNGFAIGGWYMADDGETDYVKGHAWGVTSKMNLTDNLTLFGGYGQYDDQYFGETYFGCASGPASCSGDPALGTYANPTDNSFETWTLGLSWDVVPGLLIQPEYTAVSYDDENTSTRRNFGRWSLRVVRSF